MRKSRWLALVVLPIVLTASVAIAGAVSRTFDARLSGAEEVPPVETRASGHTVLKLDKEEAALGYRVTVTSIDGVTQAHIHCGPAGVNGPIVAFLFGFNPVGVTPQGVLSRGTLTDANVIPRPDSAECPGGVSDLADVVEKIRTGGAYVNVHTLEWPGGEVRGQIEARGPNS